MVMNYQSAVVDADIPRDYLPDAALDPRQRELLQKHRKESLKPSSRLMTLRDVLSDLHCNFVVDEEDVWDLDAVEWRDTIWRPVYQWAQMGFTMLSTTAQVPQQALRDWLRRGKDIEQLLNDRKVIFLPDHIFPVIDEPRKSVWWKGTRYVIGRNGQFRLLKLLLQQSPRKVPFLKVSEHFSASDGMSDEAIHQIVCRLRKLLPVNLRPCIINEERTLQFVRPLLHVIGRFKTSHSWALQNQQRCECSVSALKLVFRARGIAASLCFSGS